MRMTFPFFILIKIKDWESSCSPSKKGLFRIKFIALIKITNLGMFSYVKDKSLKFERISLGIKRQKIFLMYSGTIGKEHIIIEVNIIITKGRNQIITPFPYMRGIDANIPKNAPLELIKLIVKINKTEKTKTIINLNLFPSFLF